MGVGLGRKRVGRREGAAVPRSRRERLVSPFSAVAIFQPDAAWRILWAAPGQGAALS
jgi:hypothetical protein